MRLEGLLWSPDVKIQAPEPPRRQSRRETTRDRVGVDETFARGRRGGTSNIDTAFLVELAVGMVF